MASTAAVRSALAVQLAEVLGAGVNVYAVPPDTIHAPAVVIGSIDWQDATLGGDRTSTVPLWVMVSRRNTQFIGELDALCDPADTASVPAAINADPTLDGVVDSARVIGGGDYRDLEVGGVDHYAGTLTVEVFH